MIQESFEILLTDFLNFRLCTISSGDKIIQKCYQDFSELVSFIITSTYGAKQIKSLSSDKVKELTSLRRIILPDSMIYKAKQIKTEVHSRIYSVSSVINDFNTGKILIRKVSSAIQILHLEQNFEEIENGSLVYIQNEKIIRQVLDGYMCTKALMNYVNSGKIVNKISKTQKYQKMSKRVMLYSNSLGNMVVNQKYKFILVDRENNKVWMFDKNGMVNLVILRT
ncbi:hypothetical protein KAJ27_15575 [bacterium]|nr:hypothetical protein [bacterium]